MCHHSHSFVGRRIVHCLSIVTYTIHADDNHDRSQEAQEEMEEIEKKKDFFQAFCFLFLHTERVVCSCS